MEKSRRKNGSSMSDRQMAQAAVRGHRIAFRTVVGMRVGYLVGMDDFHYLVAVIEETSGNPHPGAVTLIHKSCPVIEFQGFGLTSESERIRQWVSGVGESFWNHCKTTYMGLGPTPSNEQEQQ